MTEPGVDAERYVIRRLRMAHCSGGPERCKLCAAATEHKLYLLDIAPPRAGEVQRPVIEVTRRGKQAWREYDIVRSFADEREALEYARQHGIEDVNLNSGEADAQER